MDSPVEDEYAAKRFKSSMDESPTLTKDGKENVDAESYHTAPSPFVTALNTSEFTDRLCEGGMLKRKSPKRKDGEKKFTEKEVQKIVEEALAERETVIRAEFTAVLNDLLREQFESFTRFNQDFVSRQFRNSDDSSYIS